MRFVAAYLGAGLAIGTLDAFWLYFANARIYRPVLGTILTNGFRPIPAVLFYLVYLVGVVIFAVSPALRGSRWQSATLMGGLFGFFAYATYDLTNQATLVVWATRITLVDLTWGTLLTATGATAGYFAATLVKA